MDIINKIYKTENTTLYEITTINDTNIQLMIPSFVVDYVSEDVLLDTYVPNRVMGNFYIKDNDVVLLSKVPTVELGAHLLNNMNFMTSLHKEGGPQIDNILSLFDFFRQNEVPIFTDDADRRKSFETPFEVYTETPDIYLANFKNIKYSSVNLNVSIPYVIKGTLLDKVNGTTSEVTRRASYTIVNQYGEPVDSITCLLSKELKDKLDVLLSEHMRYTIVNNIKDDLICTFDLKHHSKYAPNVMCNPYYIYNTVASLNKTKQAIKGFRNAKNIIEDELRNQGVEIADSNIYNIPPIQEEPNYIQGVQFYIYRSKTMPSFRKTVEKYADYTKLMQVARACMTIPYEKTKELLLSLGTNDDILLKAFITGIDINGDPSVTVLQNKVNELNKLIKQLESLRELLKARLNYIRFVIVTNKMDLTDLGKGSLAEGSTPTFATYNIGKGLIIERS